MSARELIILLAMCAVWGFHFVVIKVAVEDAPPIFYAAIRMTVVAITMAAFLKWRPGEMFQVFVAGICLGAANYALLFTGLKYATASEAAIAIELYAPFATILSIFMLQEKVGWRRAIGIAIAFVGVAVIVLGSGDTQQSSSLLGISLVACGAFVEAFGAIFVKRSRGFKPHELLAWFAVTGTVILWPLTFLLETGQGDALAQGNLPLLTAAIIYSALGASIFAHSAYYWLLQRLPVSQVAPSGLLTTLIAIAGGVFILGDPLGPSFLIGGALTMIGVGIVLLRGAVQKDPSPATLEPPQ